jgi:hypothetical protein
MYHGNIEPLLGVAFWRIDRRDVGVHYACTLGYGHDTNGYNLHRNRKRSGMALYFFQAIGLVGAAIYVVAYFSNQARWLDARDWRFPAANLAGALLILVSLFGEWNLPSVVIEAFWAAISVYGLLNRA